MTQVKTARVIRSAQGQIYGITETNIAYVFLGFSDLTWRMIGSGNNVQKPSAYNGSEWIDIDRKEYHVPSCIK